MKTAIYRVLFLSLLALTSAGSISAQTLPCGNIIGPENIFLPNSNIETRSIDDCSDPFKKTGILGHFQIDNIEIPDNGSRTISSNGVSNYGLIPGNSYLTDEFQIYKHEGDNYGYIETEIIEPTSAEYRQLAEIFFTAPADVEKYMEILYDSDNGIYFEDENGEHLIDETTGLTVYERFDSFLNYLDSEIIPKRPILLPGTYTAVLAYQPVILGQIEKSENILTYLASFLIPIAHAQYIPPDVILTITFTLTEEDSEPIGASSILFLPGIQASRLYIEENGIENRIWEPNINADVTKLEMTAEGSSVNNIYTRDVVDEIFGINNVYRGFLDMLEDLESDQVIADSLAFAYDWRFSIEDVVVEGTKYENEIKSLIDEIESLSDGSYTDKVTIIGHSNGGLVAKALIRELDRLGKSDLVDKLVMVGTPQLGTPKAIGSMLHGLDQQAGAGLIIDDETAREVIKNMPGAYTLLPSQKYFDKSGENVITSDQTTNTASVRAYGDINSVSELNNFLLDTNNLRNDDVSNNEPGTLNSGLVTGLMETRAWLDSWEAPDGVEVYEIIGTGLTTIKGFDYRSFPCTVAIAAVCISGQYMKAYPLFSDAGDETVMALSAGGYEDDKVSAKVDLFLEGDQPLVTTRKHANLTESPTVQEYLDSIIRFPYLNETLEIPEDFVDVTREYTIIGSHSPVALTLEDNVGNQVGVIDGEIVEDIPGSQYIELGGSTYIVIPKETTYTAKIKGTGTGIYSITIDKLDGAVQALEYVYKGASSTPQMQAVFTASSTGFSNIETDLNGDGLIDLKQTLNGEIIAPVIVYTYSDLTLRVKGLGLTKLLQQLLLVQVQLAERFSLKPGQTKLELLTLRGIEDTLKLYERKRLITSLQRSEIQEIINYLKI